jgi:hypothetical protein
MSLLHSLLNYIDYIPSLLASLDCGVKGSSWPWGAGDSVVVRDRNKRPFWAFSSMKNSQLVYSSSFTLGDSHCQHVPLGKEKDLLMDRIN